MGILACAIAENRFHVHFTRREWDFTARFCNLVWRKSDENMVGLNTYTVTSYIHNPWLPVKCSIIDVPVPLYQNRRAVTTSGSRNLAASNCCCFGPGSCLVSWPNGSVAQFYASRFGIGFRFMLSSIRRSMYFLTVKFDIFLSCCFRAYKLGCKAFLWLTADRKQNGMIITEMIKEHTHPTANTIDEFHLVANRILFINLLIIQSIESY